VAVVVHVVVVVEVVVVAAGGTQAAGMLWLRMSLTPRTLWRGAAVGALEMGMDLNESVESGCEGCWDVVDA